MFTITSSHALNWPGLKFKIKKGDNKFADADAVPAAARTKVARFRERGVLKFDLPKGWGFEDNLPAEDAEGATKPEGGGFDPATAELTAEALVKLKLDQLKLVAAELEVDASALKTKQEFIAAILKEAAAGTSSS